MCLKITRLKILVLKNARLKTRLDITRTTNRLRSTRLDIRSLPCGCGFQHQSKRPLCGRGEAGGPRRQDRVCVLGGKPPLIQQFCFSKDFHIFTAFDSFSAYIFHFSRVFRFFSHFNAFSSNFLFIFQLFYFLFICIVRLCIMSQKSDILIK